jgi:hypothetical protein
MASRFPTAGSQDFYQGRGGSQNLLLQLLWHKTNRIYYGIHHPIQYNVKVKDVGQVLPHHVPNLIGNWKAEDESEMRQTAEVIATAEKPELPYVSEEEH